MDLQGLNSLSYVGGIGSAQGMQILGNTSLTNLSGLEGLDSVTVFIIKENQTLADLSGLDSLQHISGTFNIINNPNLRSLNGPTSLTSIKGSIDVFNNDSLITLAGLEALTSIGGHLLITGNDALISLHGLDNISYIGFYLHIYNNISLSECDLEGICNYLKDPNGTIMIYDNAPGCNNQQEVADACMFGLNGDCTIELTNAIYPNPASKLITIESPASGHISILNLSGQALLTQSKQEGKTEIDISGLAGGLYFVKVIHDRTIRLGKFVKQ
jgi:hypothetical protein